MLLAVASTGRCNTSIKSLCWSFKLQRFYGSRWWMTGARAAQEVLGFIRPGSTVTMQTTENAAEIQNTTPGEPISKSNP